MSKYGDYRICFSNDLSDPKNQVTIIGDKEPLRQFQKQMDKWRGARKKAEEYEAKNKELLEELKYLKKVNDDLVWQRDTDEEHEAKAKAFDAICKAHEPLERRMSPVTVDEGLDFAVETEKIILKIYESGETNA